MLSPLHRLLGRPSGSNALVDRILTLIDERWPTAPDEPVDLANLHAEILEVVFKVIPGSGPLAGSDPLPSTGPLPGTGRLVGTGRLPSTGRLPGTGRLGQAAAWLDRRAAVADAYFAPAAWWPEPADADDPTTVAVERQLQARYALVYAILESAVREQPPRDLATRLVARVTSALSAPYHDGRAPWQRPDRPDIGLCLTWLAACPEDEALAVLERLVAGVYDTGPHPPPPGVAGPPQRSYAIYAQPLLAALPVCLERLWAAGRLDQTMLERLPSLLPGLLEAISAPPEANVFLPAVSPAFAAVLAGWIDRTARALTAEITPATLPAIKRFERVHGVWALERVAAAMRQWKLDRLPVSGYQQSPRLSSGLTHLARIAWPATDEEDAEVARRLRALGEPVILTLLPLATGFRRHLLAALDWPGAAEVVFLLEHLTGPVPVDTGNHRLRFGPLPGILEPAALRPSLTQLGEARLRRLLDSFRQHQPGTARAVELIEAVMDWNRARVQLSVERRHVAALPAFGLLPPRDAADIAARYRILTQLLDAAASAASPTERHEQERAAWAGLINLAVTAGFGDVSRLEWALADSASARLAAASSQWSIDSRYRLRLELAHGRPLLSLWQDDQRLTTAPPDLRAHPTLTTARRHLAVVRRQAARLCTMLERLMADGEPLQPRDLSLLARHPLAEHLLHQLLVIDGAQRVGWCHAAGPALVTADGQTAPITGPVRLVHPLDLSAVDALSHWQHWLVARRVVQPFPQVFREYYPSLPVAASLANHHAAAGSEVDAIDHYAGQEVDADLARPLLEAAGWTVEPGFWPYRDITAARLRAVLTLAEDGPLLDAGARWRLGSLIFLPLVRLGAGFELDSAVPMPLAQVPPIVLSEGLRLVDQLLAQAQPWHSPGERVYPAAIVARRADLVRALTTTLDLRHVRLANHVAVIVGRRGTYRVDLATAAVLVEPNRQLGPLPASQLRRPPYLPSLDEDRRTAQVVSTVLLLAADDQITNAALLALLHSST